MSCNILKPPAKSEGPDETEKVRSSQRTAAMRAPVEQEQGVVTRHEGLEGRIRSIQYTRECKGQSKLLRFLAGQCSSSQEEGSHA